MTKYTQSHGMYDIYSQYAPILLRKSNCVGRERSFFFCILFFCTFFFVFLFFFELFFFFCIFFFCCRCLPIFPCLPRTTQTLILKGAAKFFSSNLICFFLVKQDIRDETRTSASIFFFFVLFGQTSCVLFFLNWSIFYFWKK